MDKINYEEIGLKCGLEIHQQLNTNKLFCDCLSVLRKDEPDFEIKRKLHAVAGESGSVDVAAKHEAEKDREFVYQGYDTVCLVELDEEPPHEINKEALNVALHIALLFGCKVIPLVQIMRKTVIDGSNTSGFQRTLLIAKDGRVESSSGEVRIETICLEEDAARIIEKSEEKTIYRLDRLGIPLVEIVTAPDIKSPEHAKEIALHIGSLLRSCNIRRGIGSIRQDINISIKGSSRVEIKGFQDPKVMIKSIENEIQRQKILVESGKKNSSEVRQILPDGTTKFLRPMPGAARMYPETDLPLLKISKSMIDYAKKTLPKLKSDSEKEFVKKGLNQEMVKLLFNQNKLEEFKELSKIIDNPSLIAKILLIFPKEIASHKKFDADKTEEIFNIDTLAFVLESLRDKKISENQIKEVLERISDDKDIEEAIKFEKINLDNIEEKILKIIKEKSNLSEKAYMGLVMKEFRGKIDGKTALDIIKKLMN